MISCDFADFEEHVDLVFQLGRTPIIVDDSPDEKVCAYFGYQPDVVVYDAEAMVAAWSLRYQQSLQINPNSTDSMGHVLHAKVIIQELLEPLRRTLVEAMKFGKLLAVRLGTSAPDFVHKFSDDALGIDNTQRETGYFPLEAFERGGCVLREPNRQASQSTRTTITEGVHRELTWAERLFREDDMKPHRNVAFCRDTFRLCLVSKLPANQVEEYIFGLATAVSKATAANGYAGGGGEASSGSGGGMLPGRDQFTLVVVRHES